MLLNANLYTWSFRVAEWAWEAEELAQKVADAIMDTSGGEASISETAAEIGGLAAGSVLGALMLAPLELEPDLDVDVEPATTSGPDDGGDAQSSADATSAAIDTTAKAPNAAAAKAAAPATTVPVALPVAPVAHLPILPAEPATADAPRGRWVLKGYRTEIAFSVHPDQNKMDLAFQANEQSGAEIDNKARARRPLATRAQPSPTRFEGSRPWHDRGPEPE